MASTSDVLDHHLKCFGENDLDGILADYSPDAILFMPGGPLKGPDAIKPVFQAIFSEFAKREDSRAILRCETHTEALNSPSSGLRASVDACMPGCRS